MAFASCFDCVYPWHTKRCERRPRYGFAQIDGGLEVSVGPKRMLFCNAIWIISGPLRAYCSRRNKKKKIFEICAPATEAPKGFSEQS